MKKYKVLKESMESPFMNFKYELGKRYICKNFNPDTKVDCAEGFYATDIEGLLYANLSENKKVFECEVSGKQVIIDQFKQRFEEIKLIREIPIMELKELVKEESDKLDYNLYEALFPIDPREIEYKKITKEHIELLKKWNFIMDSVSDSIGRHIRDSVGFPVSDSVKPSIRDYVRDSIRDSVWGSVWPSVWGSIRDSVWGSISDSVGRPIRDSVGHSIWAYISSLFPIKKWKYIEHKEGENPFQPAIDLWKQGIVPSFDGKVWRLHAGKNMKTVWKGKI